MTQNKIFVSNIPYKLSREDITEYFSTNAGDILFITFPSKSLNFKYNPGKCFIQFKDDTSVSNAIKLNGQCILGQPIYISKVSSLPKKDNSFSDNYIIPRRRFQTIRQQQIYNRYCEKEDDFDQKNGRFKGGYLLSEDFSDYCLQPRRVRLITHDVRPVFPHHLDSSFSPSISA